MFIEYSVTMHTHSKEKLSNLIGSYRYVAIVRCVANWGDMFLKRGGWLPSYGRIVFFLYTECVLHEMHLPYNFVEFYKKAWAGTVQSGVAC